MIKVSREAKSVLDRLTEGLEKPGHHREIDNAPGTFMAVHVEHTGECSLGPMFSVAHYYEQNGDLMKNPDMVFIRADGDYYPIEFQQDPVIYQCAVQWDGRGKISGVNIKLQRNLARFTAKWMRNFSQEQKLKVRNQSRKKLKQKEEEMKRMMEACVVPVLLCCVSLAPKGPRTVNVSVRKIDIV